MFFGILVCTCGQERVKDDYADDTGDNFRKGLIFCVCYSLCPYAVLTSPQKSLGWRYNY